MISSSILPLPCFPPFTPYPFPFTPFKDVSENLWVMDSLIKGREGGFIQENKMQKPWCLVFNRPQVRANSESSLK